MDMFIRTRVIDIFDRLAEVEQLAAELYQWYAMRFSDDAAVRELFETMSREEEGHRDLVLRQQLSVSRSLSAGDYVEVNLAGIDQVANAMLLQMENTAPSLREALDFAIWMETTGMESAYRLAAAKYNPEFASLASEISADDNRHLQRLKDFQLHLFSQNEVRHRSMPEAD
jgi:rubrerythrin